MITTRLITGVALGHLVRLVVWPFLFRINNCQVRLMIVNYLFIIEYCSIINDRQLPKYLSNSGIINDRQI